VTVFSGVYLVWLASAGFRGDWFESRVGEAYSLGGVAALGAFLIGSIINIPTANRIGALTRETQTPTDGVPPAHNQALRRLAARLLWGTRAVALLVGLATTAMGLARHLG
jgi:hypothetical protein